MNCMKMLSFSNYVESFVENCLELERLNFWWFLFELLTVCPHLQCFFFSIFFF